MSALALGRIPPEQYSQYRYAAIFDAYKWDPQVEDQSTVAEHAVLMDAATARKLESWAEKLAGETVLAERAMLKRPELAKRLGLPRAVRRALGIMDGGAPERHIRLMRFDFHPTADGWAVSEVNSDVPGGLAEASALPELAARFFPGYGPRGSVARSLLEAFRARAAPGARIAFVHATAYSDDRQVMQFLGDHFEASGFRALYAAPDHLAWDAKRAVSLVRGEEGAVDGIVRFFPLEWLVNLPRRADWAGYYDTQTPSCNHPVAIFAQSKRLPLVWDELGVDLSAWKALLPATESPTRKSDGGWIFKPALGRVGEGVSVREAVTDKELRRIRRAVRRRPGGWIAQKRFESRAVSGEDGTAYHLCIGVFTVDGRAAGFYGRAGIYPRIDARAKDIPVLVEMERNIV
ncbi:MAG: glutathionylspermidine synthase family protein [Oscillospiraceae bacterium]|jgi:glutathionylspermidine synthase|nr:glutathionylspermidine synthase family protein [Oscillospiraceae bacterium]